MVHSGFYEKPGGNRMIKEICVPKLGAKMEQAVLVSWNKGVGDSVEEGEALFEVETDKVVSEIEAEASGRLSRILVREGEEVLPGRVVAEIEVAD